MNPSNQRELEVLSVEGSIHQRASRRYQLFGLITDNYISGQMPLPLNVHALRRFIGIRDLACIPLTGPGSLAFIDSFDIFTFFIQQVQNGE